MATTAGISPPRSLHRRVVQPSSGVRGLGRNASDKLERIGPAELLYPQSRTLGIARGAQGSLGEMGSGKEVDSLGETLQTFEQKRGWRMDLLGRLLRAVASQSSWGSLAGRHGAGRAQTFPASLRRRTAALLAGDNAGWSASMSTPLRFYERARFLEMDAVSVRNLELVEPLFSGESRRRLCFIRWMRVALRWASGCCGLRCCGLRVSWGRLRLGWRRWVRLRPICASARGCGGRWWRARSGAAAGAGGAGFGRTARGDGAGRDAGCLPGILAAVGAFEAGLWRRLGGAPGIMENPTHRDKTAMNGAPDLGGEVGQRFDALEDLTR